MMRSANILICLFELIFIRCRPITNTSSPTPTNKDSIQYIDNSLQGDYWYKGLAEVNAFELTQARYGQLHKGDAVLIFVTEDFNSAKQVKSDDPVSAGNLRQPVFKLNMLKRFNTGIYTYNLMLSVFSPVGQRVIPHPIKLSCSVQDWCGQVFAQTNYKNNSYWVQSFSYFESAGDSTYQLKCHWTEDEIWNQIRINPDKLPVGNISLLCGLFYSRLKHQSFQYYNAEATLLQNSDSTQEYKIHYPELNRDLIIKFEKNYPYKIHGWKESYQDGKEILMTEARLLNSMMTDYWTKHNVEDSTYRQSLKLH